MQPIELEYQLDFNDYQEANLSIFKHIPKYQEALNLNRYYVLLLYVLGIGMLAFFVAALFQFDRLSVWLIVFGLILIGIWVIYTNRDMREFTLDYFKKSYQLEKANFESPVRLTVYPTYVQQINAFSSVEFKWLFIQAILDETEHIILVTHNNRVIVIPKRAFKSPADQQIALQQFAQYHADAQLAE